ncbi:MAG: dephospho-CoA kinase [Actinomycetota bacterium]
MLLVGLTGGIGSGKSSFAALLSELGAHVIDADELGRDALRPVEPAWRAVVDHFGEEILVPSSNEVDRKRLAGIVFADKDKLAALNSIVHPEIMRGIGNALDLLRGTNDIVVLDAALIVELGLHETVDVLIVVTASDKARSERLVERGMNVEDALARMAAQAPSEQLLKRADIVVNNDGDLDALRAEAARVFADLHSRVA